MKNDYTGKESISEEETNASAQEKKMPWGSIVGGLVIVLLFILSWYVTRQYETEIVSFVGQYSVFGMFVFVGLNILSVVLAPFNTLFLLPAGTLLWGPLVTALLSILAWTIGGVGAYAVARNVGRPILGKFVNLKRVDSISKSIPSKHIFWWVVMMRMLVSVDLLSYALGFLVAMSYRSYTLATLIGVTPFAFIFAYAVSFSFKFVLAAGILATLASITGAFLLYRNTSRGKVSS